MTRVATGSSIDHGVQTLQTRQRELLEAQARLTSGKRVTRVGDDPVAMARAERAMTATARAETDLRAVETSRHAVSLAESALGDADDLMQQAREHMVAAGNGSWGAAERAVAAQALRDVRARLLGIANVDDGSGGFVFGGQHSAQPPFVDGAGGVTWRATAGAKATRDDGPLPMSVDGRAAWLSTPRGNGVFETTRVAGGGAAWVDAGRVVDPSALTGSDYEVRFSVASGVTTYGVWRDGVATAIANVPYQPARAIEFDGMAVTVDGVPADGDAFGVVPSQPTLSTFEALERAAAVLGDASASQAEVTQAVKFGLRDLDVLSSTVQLHRAEAGAWLNRLDDVSARHADAKLHAQTERSAAEDLDMVEAVSDFQSKQTAYDAALKAYGLIQKMSLFDHL